MRTLLWRLHWRQAYFALAALVVLTIVLLVTGITMAGEYHSFFATCGATHSCGEASSVLFRGDGAIIDLVGATAAIPLLFGLFWGAPLVAKEIEDGTQSLAWTQSVTRRQWLSSNLAWVFTAAVLWAGALTVVVSWWRGPLNALDTRFGAFDIQGVAPIAYALFAVALGIFAGTLVKRALPALAVTLGAFVVVRVLVAHFLRPHYLAAVTHVSSLGRGPLGVPAGAWLLNQGLVAPGSNVVSNAVDLSLVPVACQNGFAGDKGVGLQCLIEHGYKQSVTYQPAGRFWAFQGIETAIFVALALVLLAVTYRVVVRRDA